MGRGEEEKALEDWVKGKEGGGKGREAEEREA